MPEPLPIYSEVDEVPSPPYSEARFIIEEITRTTRQSAPTGDVWTYITQHMEVNLGDREAWSPRTLAYGLDGIVQGHVKLKGAQAHVRQVTATFEGTITIKSLDRGMITDQSETQLFSRQMTFYVHTANGPSTWAEKYDFAIPLPNEVDVANAMTALPPTTLLYYLATSAEVVYSLTFDMIRKGWRRHERLAIPIAYLPKSCPRHPMITGLPLPSVDFLRNPIPVDDQILVRKMNPVWPKSQAPNGPCGSAFLFLPSSPCVTSGESFPFLLSMFAPDSPALAKLLMSNMQVKLLKRSSFTAKTGQSASIDDVQLALAMLREVPQSSEGLCIFRGRVRAGKTGREYSWGIKGIAEVKYIFSVSLNPPDGMVGHLPSFKHEEVIEVTTDRFGSLEGDRPARSKPALELLKSLESIPKLRPMSMSPYSSVLGPWP